MSKANIIDSLFDINMEDESLLSEDIIVPKRCSLCKNTIICSVLPTFIGLSRIKIHVNIESCPFFDPIKANGK